MRTRHRERETTLLGMLLFTCLTLLVFLGCQGSPLGGCPPGFSEGDDARLANGTGAVDNGSHAGGEGGLEQSLFCIVFPRFCQSYCPPDPLDPLYAWGGPSFDPDPAQVPALAQWHNACLTAWRGSRHTPEALLATMEAQAEKLHLGRVLEPESRRLCLDLFQSLLDGEVHHNMLPSHEVIMQAWRDRPREGPFAHDTECGPLLEALADGISPEEVIAWQSYAESKFMALPREYWAASSMAASVAWWHDFSQEVGEDCSFGLFADLAAMQETQDWRIVAVASLAGALVDFYKHFWPNE